MAVTTRNDGFVGQHAYAKRPFARFPCAMHVQWKNGPCAC
jgi:hypothetical protein